MPLSSRGCAETVSGVGQNVRQTPGGDPHESSSPPRRRHRRPRCQCRRRVVRDHPGFGAKALRFATEGTVVVWWDGRLPNTERGNEEVFHSARFKVGTGGVTGTWSEWKRSKVSSIAR